MNVIAETFAPGEFLREELESRGWTQVELAEIIGRPTRLVNEIIAGKKGVTPETAIQLGEALGTGAELWMNLESQFQLSKVKKSNDLIVRRAHLYGKYPVRDMIKRGWIQASESIDVLEQQFLRFFSISSLDEEPEVAHAAKKTGEAPASMVQKAWLKRAQQLAKAAPVSGTFSDEALDECHAELKRCLGHVEAAKNVPAILAKAGIRLVILEPLPGAKIGGACFWLDPKSPVVAHALRFDRIDNFWHTLMHELDHVRHREGMERPIVESLDESDWSKLSPNERRANEAGAEFLVARSEMQGFVARVNPMFTKQQIIGFALRIGVHPGIVVGQLQNDGCIPFSFHKDTLEKVRAVVAPMALTDGYGQTVNI